MSAPPIALLHGFAGHAESFDGLVARLAGRRVEAMTLFGHDPARPARADVAFDDEVERVAGWLRGLGGPVRLVGYSLGGRVALGVLGRAPELLHSVVLVGAHPGLASEAERAARAAADEAHVTLLRDRGIEAFVETWERLPLFASQAAVPRERLERQRQIRLRHDARSLGHAMRSLGLGAMPPRWDVLAASDVPVELVVGGLDAKFREIALQVRDRSPNKPRAVTVVEGAGHNVVLERPDALASIVVGDPHEAWKRAPGYGYDPTG